MIAKIWNYNFWIGDTNPNELKKKYEKILIDSGFNICGFIDKKFNPYGYTCVWILAESHLAIHTFPEENKTYIELSSCIKNKFDNFKKNLTL